VNINSKLINSEATYNLNSLLDFFLVIFLYYV